MAEQVKIEDRRMLLCFYYDSAGLFKQALFSRSVFSSNLLKSSRHSWHSASYVPLRLLILFCALPSMEFSFFSIL
ncbi:unnamed protein product [Haemonchus placei]|uniref:Uncharacterized protein n=1 Tax=Haemonchus placei TaxID=6290 RepID=A0A3P7T9B8_HAEPC|nr:unnamed protein product [Haemonchus placei]